MEESNTQLKCVSSKSKCLYGSVAWPGSQELAARGKCSADDKQHYYTEFCWGGNLRKKKRVCGEGCGSAREEKNQPSGLATLSWSGRQIDGQQAEGQPACIFEKENCFEIHSWVFFLQSTKLAWCSLIDWMALALLHAIHKTILTNIYSSYQECIQIFHVYICSLTPIKAMSLYVHSVTKTKRMDFHNHATCSFQTLELLAMCTCSWFVALPAGVSWDRSFWFKTDESVQRMMTDQPGQGPTRHCRVIFLHPDSSVLASGWLNEG